MKNKTTTNGTTDVIIKVTAEERKGTITMSIKENSDYYTVAEAAEILRCKDRQKVYILCRSRVFKAFQLGRNWLIDRKDFDKWRKAQMDFHSTVY
jgi:excisionase family DNA binding protein